MNQLLHYLYNCNKKKMWIIYIGFITISLILLFNFMGSAKHMTPVKQNIILALFILLFCITVFSIGLIAVSSFRRMLKNSMIRYTAVPAKKYLYANLLFFALMIMLLSLIGLGFVHFFSLNIYERKTNGEIQQAMRHLYNYGSLHHLFSIFSLIVDLTNTLVSIYFIIAVIKLFNVNSLLSKVLFIFFFLILGGIQIFITNVFEKIDNYLLYTKNITLMGKNSYFEISSYSIEGVSITYVCVTLLSTFLFIFITSYIIDKKLEV
ncbi:ABC transporter permease [Bacillus cereus group sp. BfR-BA-01380]|uniref:ABC transporter permease n=1 Tax=Bacillus cereus group sp. BfR-BA-01380 TaxID=2920324 RepID=UPI001F55D9E7|nr:ABC transporter permease [Bacillus cereus group sp. BfR-BA-01380]